MVKVIFFQAHPDDLEFYCGHIMHYLASKPQYTIKIASLTKGEFGLPGAEYDKFKGKVLAKIRTQELVNAQQLHDIPPQNIEFFGYIDGFIEFNIKLVEDISNYLRKEKPAIIFAPEPLYTFYYHKDHINTGKAVFYIIFYKILDFVPKLYFYSSLQSNFYFGFKKKDIQLTRNLIACHKTQAWLMNPLMMSYKPIMRLYGRKLRKWKYAEGYRRVFFHFLEKNKPSLFSRILSHFFYSHPQWFRAKYPQNVLENLKKLNKL